MLVKRVFVIFSLIMFCFLFVQFCDSNYSTTPDESPIYAKSQQNSDEDLRLICANNYYADRLFSSTDNFSWDPCQDGHDEEIEGYECAYLWAAFNPY
jgi:hypothetical protein